MRAKLLLAMLATLPALAGSLSSTFGPAPALAQSPALPAPTVRPAIDGVLAAFATYPLVALGDHYALAQEADFYAALISDPRFAREVGNVVFEFGSAAHQATIDRYLAGETVPESELRKVLMETTSLSSEVRLGYLNFFVRVRAVNLPLPPERRIRVWLGDPPVDWAKIAAMADALPYLQRRDPHAAELINREILAKKKKALVIAGIYRFLRAPPPPLPNPAGRPLPPPPPNLKELISKDHPKALFIVAPYRGFLQKPCSTDFEQGIKAWPTPALVTPVRGTTVENALMRPGCSPALAAFPPSMQTMLDRIPEQERLAWQKTTDEAQSGVAADALLYLGPAATLVKTALVPNIDLDPEYRKEIDRRRQMLPGGGPPAETSPTFIRP